MKNTKKSMFITTVLMVAVLIVAVSTATFAWYTASDRGGASSAVVTSATASSANIAVGWTNSATTTDIVFNGAQTIQPMVPNGVIKPAEGKNAVEAITFQTANIDSEDKFGAVGSGTPWMVENALIENGEGAEDDIAAGTYDHFFVINHNVNAGAVVTVKATISGDLANMLLIAVFVDGELGGILSNRTAYTVGPVGAGNNYNDLTDTAAEYIESATNGFTFDLTASGTTGNFAKITVAAWLDGEALVSSEAGKSASFALNFSATPKAATQG